MSAKPETAPYRDALSRRPGEPRWLAEAARRRARALRRARLSDAPRGGLALHRSAPAAATRLSRRRPASPAATPWRCEPYFFAGETHRIVLVNGRFAPALSEIGTLPKGVWLGSTARDARRTAGARSQPARSRPIAGAPAFCLAQRRVLRRRLRAGARSGRDARTAGRDHPSGRDAGAAARSICAISSCSAPAAARRSSRPIAGERRVLDQRRHARVRLGAGAALRHMPHPGRRRRARSISRSGPRDAGAQGALRELRPDARRAACRARTVWCASRARARHAGSYGAYLLRGEQEATTATFVDHAAPDVHHARALQGRGRRSRAWRLPRHASRCAADAQKTDAQQLNRNLLLSRRAPRSTPSPSSKSSPTT